MKNSHSITDCWYHFVFVTKYRSPFHFDSVSEDFIRDFCLQRRCELISFGAASDHIHIMVELHPSFSVSDFACKVKSYLSGYLGKAAGAFPGFQTGYFCASVGLLNRHKVQEYINNQ